MNTIKTILLVSSNSKADLEIESKLKSLGYEVFSVDSILTVSKALKNFTDISIVLIDIQFLSAWNEDKEIHSAVAKQNLPVLCMVESESDIDDNSDSHNFSIIEKSSSSLVINQMISMTYRLNLSDFNRIKSQNFLTSLLEILPDLVWAKDINGIYLFCNIRFENFFGAKKAEIIGKTDYDFTDKETAALFRKNDEIAIEAGKPSINEEILTFANDGHKEHCETIKVPLYDINGKVYGVVGIARDITDRKKNEKKLTEEKDHSRELINSLPGLYYQIRADGKFIAWNKEFENVSGYSSQEVSLMNPIEFIVDKDKKSIKLGINKAFSDGYSETAALFLSKDGTKTPYYFNATKIIIDSVSYIIGMGVDISALKNTEKTLLKTMGREQFLADIYRKSPVAIAIAYPDGSFGESNEEFIKMTGYTNEELRNLSWTNVLTSSKWHEFEQKKLGQMTAENKVVKYEKEYIKKDGTVFPVSLSVMGNFNDDGVLSYYIGYIQDISGRKIMEADLRNSQKLKAIGTLASGVAHEINNPINGIMNYSQLILDESENNESFQQYAQEIINETDRVAEIVKNLLLFSREEVAQYSLVHIEEIIEKTLSLIRTIIKRDQITLDLNLEKNLPTILCRDQQIQQVLMNLLTNARDALNEKYEGYDKNKKIIVSCKTFNKENKDWIRFSVKDFGNGISSKISGDIFNPFFTTKRADSGTGLGLSISYSIIKEHNGNFYFTTEEGKFCEFCVELPSGNFDD